MHAIAIVLLAIGAAVVYGVIHDQFTARICVEYFTVAHPFIPWIDYSSPTTIALGWGVIATWWVGLLLGVPLAVCARAGALPKLTARDLLRPIGVLLLVMAACSALAGLVGYWLAATDTIVLSGWAAARLGHVEDAFLADAFAHNAAYASGAVGGVIVCVLARRARRRRTVA